MTQWIQENTRFRNSEEPSRLDLLFTTEPKIVDGVEYKTPLAKNSLSALQIIRFHFPHSHPNITCIIDHLILHLTSLGHNIHLHWVPSHVSVMGNMMADRAAAEVHTNPSPTDLATDQTDSLTDLKTACTGHWDTALTDA
ncbi:hypothetical protein E2C01_029428 [Portunus trituberculatus]|uniref:RNase H type-1 domain-containing protein n=1 Tax=Portunus trituberculatus TaxID=210409 RepID=A0A5B7ERT4_PORTR|nr:hypothetical protein [Portunus trituberculatus]